MRIARRSRLGLRRRASLAFGLTGLLVAAGLGAVTYSVTERYLLAQREDTAARQAFVNARLTRSALRTAAPDVRALLAGLGGGTASDTVLRQHGDWFSTSVGVGPDTLPPELVRTVSSGHAGHQRYVDDRGELRLAVGVAIPSVDALYFESFSLDELRRTMAFLRRALTIGVLVAAALATIVGRLAAQGLLRPLRPVADAAARISDGDLRTRINEDADPDLRRLVDAFNTMAGSLQERIERETRFAADVSHELRSPLAALAAGLEVMERRRSDLPPRALEALDVMTLKVKVFEQMVLDLLEISRVDAGTAQLDVDSVDLEHLLPRLLARHGAGDVPVSFEPGAPTVVQADRRRLVQALGNIIDNARKYAGGVTGVCVSTADEDRIRIAVDDSGPGVAVDDRKAIFGRFARGEAGLRRGSNSGTGLGLALVAEHIRLHHGAVWVEESGGGGARFVVELPAGRR